MVVVLLLLLLVVVLLLLVLLALIISSLAALANRTGKKIAFDEVGYCSAPGNHLSPAGTGCNGGKASLPEQTNLVQALLQEVYPQPWFAGFYYWAWTTGGCKEKDQCKAGFTVNGKPAVHTDLPPSPPSAAAVCVCECLQRSLLRLLQFLQQKSGGADEESVHLCRARAAQTASAAALHGYAAG